MADDAGTIERIAQAIASALAPLQQQLSAGQAAAFLNSLGLALPPGLPADAQLGSALATAATSAGGLAPLITALTSAIDADDVAQIISAGVALITKIGELVGALAEIGPALSAAAGGAGLSAAQQAEVGAFAGELATKLFDYAVIEYLRAKARGVVPALAVAGLVDDTELPGDLADPLQPPYRLETLHLDRLVKLFLDPVTYLKEAFDFGNPSFDGSQLFGKISDLLDDVQLPVTILTPAGQPSVLEAFIFRLSVDPASSPPSLTMQLRIPATQDFTQTYPLGPVWQLVLSASARFDAGIGAVVTPPLGITLQPPSGTVSVNLAAGLAAQPASGAVVLFAESGGTTLEAQKVAFTLGFTGTWDSGSGTATGQPSISGEVDGGNLTIDLSQSDGFISTLLGGAKISGNLAFKLQWSPGAGLQIQGSSAIQIAIPTHVSIGPIDLQQLYLQLGLASDGSLPAELSAGFSASLGPLQAAVDRIGLTVTTTFPDSGGNLGPANLALAFKPPTGVGLSVDAGIVSGGGYLYVDTASGEYAGAMQLMFADFLTLSAIGLIDTKLPDGSAGFSLLIIITADFGAGIQLGFGFTLNAVGGLLGVNRAMLLQPLMDGVRTGAIDAIMFPQNIVANASRIISDLRAIFPPQQGTFLIGPMAKLGWGEPSLVTLSLGVIVEVPPGDIAIIGVLELALPAEDLAILVLQVNFAGALEFDKQRMYFFASLYDSHILFITIEGEMGLLFAWGANANFVVTVGGFSPQFNPPPLPFPAPQRIAVSIINESYARIQADGYFAVTTNTVQFGTQSEYFFGFSALSVSGSSGFDALIQFSPFHFSVSISTSFSVQVFGVGVYGVDIALTLDGPEPWHANGTASLSFFFFSIGIGINFTWGDSGNSTLPPVAVMLILSAEFGKQSNWRALLPAGSNLLVSLRALDPAEAQFVLHPVGTLQVSQRAIPLDLTIDTVGGQQPDDANRFGIAVSSPDLAATRTLQEEFAPAQFESASDATKLSEPAYAPQDSGIEMAAAAGQYASGTAIIRIVRYDVTIIDTKLRRALLRFAPYPGTLFQAGLRGNAAARSPLSGMQESLTHPFKGSVQVSAEKFAVARQSDNTVYHPDAAAFTSQSSARDYLNRVVAADPGMAGTLHVLPHFEVAA